MGSIEKTLLSSSTVELISWAWWLTLGSTAVFYAAAWLAPDAVARLQSMPWAFHLRRNLDLDFQSVLYATYHTRWLSRFTHLTIGVEQVAWFAVLGSWHPVLPLLALLLLVLQAARQGEAALTAFAALAWVSIWGLAALGAGVIGPDAPLIAEGVLMGCALFRVLGHVVEPLPPLIASNSDRFVPLRAVGWNPKLLSAVALGYPSEFASGLPFRLFPVQLSWALQALGFQPRRALPWQEARRIAAEIHARGWRAYGPVAALMPEGAAE